MLQQFWILLQQGKVTLFRLCGSSVYHPVFHVQKLPFENDSSDVGKGDGRGKKSLHLLLGDAEDRAVAHGFDGGKRGTVGHVAPRREERVSFGSKPE